MRRALYLGIGFAFALACIAGAQNTVVLLNTQYNAESTGNILTLPFTEDYPAGVCADGPWSNWLLNAQAVTSPTYNCIAGLSNPPGAALDYDDSATEYAANTLRLPSDWTGLIDLWLEWFSPATSGNVKWIVQTACVADNESYDASWNTAQTITDATKAGANLMNTATLSSLTTTGCSAGELFKFRIGRNPADAADTLGNTARLHHVQLTYRRAI